MVVKEIDYISHHGVKGMKWGVRRYAKTHSRSSRKTPSWYKNGTVTTSRDDLSTGRKNKYETGYYKNSAKYQKYSQLKKRYNEATKGKQTASFEWLSGIDSRDGKSLSLRRLNNIVTKVEKYPDANPFLLAQRERNKRIAESVIAGVGVGLLAFNGLRLAGSYAILNGYR